MTSSAALLPADEGHIVELMSWFADGRELADWGGPDFQLPFTPETFDRDCRWRELASFVLLTEARQMVAFGQYYLSYDAVRLARLAVSPRHRRQGFGELLIDKLIEEGVQALGVSSACLFVIRSNESAFALYRKLGFEIAEYPPDAAMGDNCYFMTRQL